MKQNLAILLVLIFLIPLVAIQYSPVRASSDQVNSGLMASTVYTPKLLWKTNIGFPSNADNSSREWSSPTVADGVVYVGATSTINFGLPVPLPNQPPYNPNNIWSNFYAFDASNGAIIWDYRDNSSHIEGPFAVADGLVFFSAGSGQTGVNYVKALNAKNGALIWTYTTEGEISAPTVSNGIVYINKRSTIGSIIYALNATNGNKIWEAPGSGTLPIVQNGILYAGAMSDGPNAKGEFIPSYAMNALNASNGKWLWNFTTEYWVSTPAVFEGTVFFTADSNIYALNAITGAKIWNYTTPHTPRTDGIGDSFTTESTSPAVNHGIVYIYSVRAETLLALKASNGAQLWNYTHAVGDPPTVANGIIYVGINGHFCALNAYNGNKIWESNLSAHDLSINPSKSPAVDENAMYFSFDTMVFSAIELPHYPSQSSPPTIVQAFTDEGQTINLTVSGNITSSEISNVYLTTDHNTTSAYIYLTVTGASHTTGFSNITLPKSLIYNETVPTVYTDDQKAEDQGYSQDANNYYVWYATDFSTHQISIIFSVPQNSNSSSSAIYTIWLGAVVAAIIALSVVAVLLVYFKKHKH